MTKRIIPAKHLSRPGPGHVPAAVAAELLALVGEHVGDPAAFLREGRLSHLAFLLERTRPDAVVARGDFTRLYARAIARLDVVAARQEGRESLTKDGVDIMVHAVMTCRTLRDVIARMTRFSILLAPRTGALTLEVSGSEGAGPGGGPATGGRETARLTMATERRVRNACSYLSDLTGLASYHRLLSWLVGEDIPLEGAAMRYPPLLGQQTVAYLLPSPVAHRAAENSLSFPARYLDRPVVRRAHEVDAMLADYPFDIAEPQSVDRPLSERIGHLFAAMLASGEALSHTGELARQFAISPATLKRRLAAEGTALSALKLAARRDLALLLLGDPRLSIAEVARRTHFSDVGAFRRAFRQWTGLSPSAWRQT